jgi:hypothetical protein
LRAIRWQASALYPRCAWDQAVRNPHIAIRADRLLPASASLACGIVDRRATLIEFEASVHPYIERERYGGESAMQPFEGPPVVNIAHF